LLADSENFTDAAAEGYRPFFSAAIFPIGRNDLRGGQIPAFRQVVVDELLPGKQIHLVVPGPVDRPDVHERGADHPITGHGQDHGRGPQTLEPT